MSEQFDVFLCHNSQDKPEVREIARKLQQQGLNPWLDEWELRPGLPWQPELEKQIHNIKSAAVFVGENGTGPWQQMEIDAYLRRFVSQGCPVIPVLLNNAPQQPDLPIFLSGMTWVDFRHSELNPMGRLIWGITGIKPANFNSSQSSTIDNKEADTFSFAIPSVSPRDTNQLQVFEFEVVKVEVKRTGFLGLGSEVTLNRTRSQAQYFTEDLGNGVDLDMVYIPGGKFMMGSPKGEGNDREKPQHQVSVQPFFMGKYPVTQAQYRQVMSNNPSHFKGDNLPIEKVSWKNAVEFCQRLSQQTGQEYRLPSEAEWEYVCRSGTTTPFHFGETITTDLANYRGTDWKYQGEVYPGNYANGPKGEYREKTTKVGNFPANAFGLYDMHGNVWEWCEDDWHESYENAPNVGTAWLSEKSSKKVRRGGSWAFIPTYCRSATRYYSFPENANGNSFGFRVVCMVPRTL